jgi:hypothetical protein
MADDEVEAFLQGRRTMCVATVGASGHPHVVAMWYGFYQGVPAFWTYAKSQKIVNLRRDPKLSCLVEDGDVVQAVGENVYQRYFGELNDAGRQAVELMGAKRAVVVIDAERVVSWDHSKLGGLY